MKHQSWKVTTLKLIWILVKIFTIKYIFLAVVFSKRLFKFYVYFSPVFPKLILFLDRCENGQTEAFKVHSLSLPLAEKENKRVQPNSCMIFLCNC